MRVVCIFLSITICAAIIGCIRRDNPYLNPNNAAITETRYPSASVLEAHSEYACSVEVMLPEFVDSLIVVACQNGACDTLLVLDTVSVDSPWVAFSVEPWEAGQCTLSITIVKSNGTSSTITEILTIVDLSPVAVAESTSYHGYLGTPLTVTFSISDPDSNLWLAFAGIDTADAAQHDTMFSPFAHVPAYTFSRTFADGAMIQAIEAGSLICYCQAFDLDSLVSVAAVCTIFVSDTTKPQVTLLPPLNDSTLAIDSLPVTISAVVTDNWGIDSVKFGTGDMVLLNDTALVEISSLESGKHLYAITVFDKAGNSTSISFPLTYSGAPVYPPKIKPLDMVITEGDAFDTLILDNYVIPTDPAITDTAAYCQSLVWIITDTAGLIWPHYMPGSRRCVIAIPADTAIPDSEWSGAVELSFKVQQSGGLSDTRNATFSVTEVPDKPIITLKNQWDASGVFDTFWVDTCANDPDNDEGTLKWSFVNGTWYKAVLINTGPALPKSSINSIPEPGIPVFRWSRRVTIVPIGTIKLPLGALSDTLLFRVADPGGASSEKKIIFSKGFSTITR